MAKQPLSQEPPLVLENILPRLFLPRVQIWSYVQEECRNLEELKDEIDGEVLSPALGRDIREKVLKSYLRR